MTRAAETAYRTIRQHIITGQLEPGSQLKEEDLAELCGVSRTPVREALRRLEAEMLIRRTDSQRTFVPDWSADEIGEVFSLRAMIESYAARRAAQQATPAQIDAMRACNDAMAAAIEQRDGTGAFVTINRQFHALVSDAAHSPRLAKMKALVIEPALLMQTARRFATANLAQSLADHRDLVTAIQDRDPEWADAIMSSHIRRAAHMFTPAPASSRHEQDGSI